MNGLRFRYMVGVIMMLLATLKGKLFFWNVVIVYRRDKRATNNFPFFFVEDSCSPNFAMELICIWVNI